MLTITRLLARQVLHIIRRALALSPRATHPIDISATAQELVLRAGNLDAAVEYRQSGQFAPDVFTIPLDLLAECEGGKAEPVTLEHSGVRQVTAQWRDRGVPQLVPRDVPAMSPAPRPCPSSRPFLNPLSRIRRSCAPPCTPPCR